MPTNSAPKVASSARSNWRHRPPPAPATARTVRVREGAARVTDGPFAETKELLAGFNLIEADSLDDAVRIAHEFPWIRYGSIEVRPVRDFEAVRRRVGA